MAFSKRTATRAGAWTGVALSTGIFAMAAGTVIGEGIVSTTHGRTPERRRELCTGFYTAFNRDAIKACVDEKTRGYETAHNAHTTIQWGSAGALALLVPLTIFGFRRSRPLAPAP